MVETLQPSVKVALSLTHGEFLCDLPVVAQVTNPDMEVVICKGDLALVVYGLQGNWIQRGLWLQHTFTARKSPWKDVQQASLYKAHDDASLLATAYQGGGIVIFSNAGRCGFNDGVAFQLQGEVETMRWSSLQDSTSLTVQTNFGLYDIGRRSSFAALLTGKAWFPRLIRVRQK